MRIFEKNNGMLMKLFRRPVRVAAVLLLAAGLSFGFYQSGNKDFEIVKNLDIFYSLFRELNLFYVDDTDPQKLMETGIHSMLESLDPYTTYISESEMDDFNFMTTGNYGGIGSVIRADGTGFTMVADPYEGSPAARAGLRGGDLILSVDGYSTRGKNLDDISERLKGTPGTEVVLEVRKPGADKDVKIKIVREQIHINNVSYYGKLDGITGYIRLSNFTMGAAEEVKDALEELQKDGGISGLVLDLRSNPGGLLLEAVRVCNLFVEQGELIVSTKGRVTQWDQDYYTTTAAFTPTLPLVVLVNRGSASAAEIVAGALQDLDRAVIVGQRTFGKGLVQTTRKLKYNTQLKVTTAKYYIPSGRCIQALDYSHRNEDGSVGYVPDSLIKEFRTRGGRKVYDGGGISPDIKDSLSNLSQIAINLYAQNVIFDYVTDYMARNSGSVPPRGYRLRESDYAAFMQFVPTRDFQYRSRSEDGLKKLIETARSEKYYDLAEAEFKALEARLGNDLEKDLRTFREEISGLIEEEMMGRYYFQRGRAEAGLASDTQLARARAVVSDGKVYEELLKSRAVITARQ
jgi:carboxyl-terminal processing protease